jgi:hypothetical protein
MFTFLHIDCKPEISNFDLLLEVNKNICRFEISMDKVMRMNSLIPIYYLRDQCDSPFLFKLSLLSEQLAECTLLAELGNDINTIFGLYDMFEIEYIRTPPQKFERFDLSLCHLYLFLTLMLYFGYDFNGDWLLWIRRELLVFSSRPL